MITWAHNYGIYRANIGPVSLLVLYVSPQEDPHGKGGYAVEIIGGATRKRVQRIFTDVDGAKQVAINSAIKWLKDTLTEIVQA